jgi:hypothetical protein
MLVPPVFKQQKETFPVASICICPIKAVTQQNRGNKEKGRGFSDLQSMQTSSRAHPALLFGG